MFGDLETSGFAIQVSSNSDPAFSVPFSFPNVGNLTAADAAESCFETSQFIDALNERLSCLIPPHLWACDNANDGHEKDDKDWNVGILSTEEVFCTSKHNSKNKKGGEKQHFLYSQYSLHDEINPPPLYFFGICCPLREYLKYSCAVNKIPPPLFHALELPLGSTIYDYSVNRPPTKFLTSVSRDEFWSCCSYSLPEGSLPRQPCCFPDVFSDVNFWPLDSIFTCLWHKDTLVQLSKHLRSGVFFVASPLPFDDDSEKEEE